jgi:hypothetical protein
MQKRVALCKITFRDTAVWDLSSAGFRDSTIVWAHIHLENDASWGQSTWTVFLKPLPQDVAGENHRALLWFLAPAAPHALLEPGVHFELVGGTRVLAEGTVLETDLTNPGTWTSDIGR